MRVAYQRQPDPAKHLAQRLWKPRRQGAGTRDPDRYGIEISRIRTDVLDQQVCDLVTRSFASGVALKLLDLGSGSAVRSIELASVGAHVTAVDMSPELPQFRAVAKCSNGSIRFRNTRIEDWLAGAALARKFDIVYSQRVFHYFPYDIALSLLKGIRRQLKPGGYAFISVSGLASELGQSYGHRSRLVSRRFARIGREMQKKHSITAPVCLYLPNEFARLLHRAGYRIQSLAISDFGNLKCVAKAEGQP
jgi:SAM-dependent methyltransferase